jgi:hypothetical protein
MSRTDKTRPYEVRTLDPSELRYWSTTANRWHLHTYPAPRPSRSLRRAWWAGSRTQQRAWRDAVMAHLDWYRNHVERAIGWLELPEAPDNRARHQVLQDGW